MAMELLDIMQFGEYAVVFPDADAIAFILLQTFASPAIQNILTYILTLK
jgi:hypothetical protein